MFERIREMLATKIKGKFTGVAEQPPRSPYGEYYQSPSPFNNFGEQVVFFATSGSSGYMKDGVYRDISGAKITEGEYIDIVSQSGLKALMDPGVLEKMWRGEKIDLVTGEPIE